MRGELWMILDVHQLQCMKLFKCPSITYFTCDLFSFPISLFLEYLMVTVHSISTS